MFGGGVNVFVNNDIHRDENRHANFYANTLYGMNGINDFDGDYFDHGMVPNTYSSSVGQRKDIPLDKPGVIARKQHIRKKNKQNTPKHIKQKNKQIKPQKLQRKFF